MIATSGVDHTHFTELLGGARRDRAVPVHLMKGIIERRGIPLALYSDRHFIFCHSKRAEDGESTVIDKDNPSEFGRAMRELGVTQVFARRGQNRDLAHAVNNGTVLVQQPAGYRRAQRACWSTPAPSRRIARPRHLWID